VGCGGWLKLRHQLTTSAIVGGVLGPVDAPDALILGRVDRDGLLRVAGATRALTKTGRAALACTFESAGGDHPWQPTLPAAWLGALAAGQESVANTRVVPTLVVEIAVDTAWEHGRWRHRPLFLRARPDLTPRDVPRDGDL